MTREIISFFTNNFENCKLNLIRALISFFNAVILWFPIATKASISGNAGRCYATQHVNKRFVMSRPILQLPLSLDNRHIWHQIIRFFFGPSSAIKTFISLAPFLQDLKFCFAIYKRIDCDLLLLCTHVQ